MTSVSTGAFYESAMFNMAKLRESTNALQQQIATGNKLTHSYDDPLAASQMRMLQAADTMATADATVSNAAKTQLTQTDDTLGQFATIVTDLQSLAAQAANSTLNDSQRKAIGVQISAYSQNLANLANAKDSAGNPLFGGQGTGAAYTDDGTGNLLYSGTGSAATLALGPGMSVTTGVTGPEFLDFTSKGTAKNLLSVVKDLGALLQNPASSAAAVSAANSALDDFSAGLDSITTSQTVVGARLAWITATGTMQTSLGSQRSTQEATTGGTDIATAAAKLSQQMTVLEAAQASFVKLANLSLFSMLN